MGGWGALVRGGETCGRARVVVGHWQATDLACLAARPNSWLLWSEMQIGLLKTKLRSGEEERVETSFYCG